MLVCAVVFPGHSVHYSIKQSHITRHSNYHRDTPHSIQLLCCNSTTYSQMCNYRNLTLDHLFWSCAAASRNSLKESLKDMFLLILHIFIILPLIAKCKSSSYCSSGKLMEMSQFLPLKSWLYFPIPVHPLVLYCSIKPPHAWAIYFQMHYVTL